jgi:hypothetical protein
MEMQITVDKNEYFLKENDALMVFPNQIICKKKCKKLPSYHIGDSGV